jgi:hypothetical protein
MKESIINKKILTVMFGFLFIGGVAAILGIFRAVKNTEHRSTTLSEEHDGCIFVYVAHA